MLRSGILSLDPRLSGRAKSFLDNAHAQGQQVAVSAVSFVEMVYLIEKGRIPPQRFGQLAGLVSGGGTLFVEVPLDLKIARALARVDVSQIPDMPDRIIAATALHLDVPLISRDGKIQLSSLTTLW